MSKTVSLALINKETKNLFFIHFLTKITIEPINPWMKPLLQICYVCLAIIFCTSCVGSKKFKALEAEKQKLENTLLSTKQDLSTAKLTLNKLKDASSSTNEQQSGKIRSQQQQIEEHQAALDAAQAALVNCQMTLQKNQTELRTQQQQHQQQITPFLKAQRGLQQQESALLAIKQDINAFLAIHPEVQMTQLLDKNELILTFAHKDLFSSVNRLSNNGRNSLYLLAEVLKRYPQVYIDILGHMPTGADSKENWKNSTRKTLSILYTLTQKEVLPNKIRVIGYGEYRPLISTEDPMAKATNSRTEIILHYQGDELLKLIPTK